VDPSDATKSVEDMLAGNPLRVEYIARAVIGGR
jgi:hypothetical protein